MSTAPAEIRQLSEGVAERERVLSAYVEAERHAIARACLDMARSFAQGGTLIPFGVGPAATDAAHAAVEFMHPVIVGKRALPAIAPTNDPARAADPARLARAGDIALGISHGRAQPEVSGFLRGAGAMGLLTISLAGGDAPAAEADHDFAVPSDDARIVQEVQETTYHVLWELVHTFFEHPGLLEESCITCGDTAVEATVVEVRDGAAVIELGGARETVATDLLEEVDVGDALLCHAGVALERLDRPEPGQRGDASADSGDASFLYPFLERREDDADAVLADVAASTAQKARDVAALRRAIDVEAVGRCGAALRDRIEGGGRLLCFGNGGSSTDAQDLAADCLAAGRPAVALTNDVATVTATANDVGFENSFSRQLIALGRPADVAVAISTSGSSANVVAGLEEAHRRGLRTCAIVGYDGGRCAELDWLDDLFVVESDYVPRIQEAQATIYHLLVAAMGAP
jgi:D-sedoheptulose 7-phosphate isomerase